MTSISERLSAAWRGLTGGAVGGARNSLPFRREAETIKYECLGFKWHGTISRFENGDVAEVFMSTAKSGEQMRAIGNDLAITASLALQYGCPLDKLRSNLVRDSGGSPQSPLAALLDKVENEK